VDDKATAGSAQGPDLLGAVYPGGAVGPALAAPGSCPTCGQPSPPLDPQATSAGWPVFAMGQLTAHTASVGADKQLAQLTGGAHQGDQIDVGLLQQVLSRHENAYMGFHLAWVLSTAGVDTFTVVPRSDDHVARLAEVLSPPEDGEVVHVIVGKTIPAPPDSPSAAAGLPAVQACQVLAFTLQEFAAAMPEDQAPSDDQEASGDDQGNRHAEFQTLVRRVFLRLTNGAALPGFTDEQRASAYVASQYPGFYHGIRHAQRDGKVLAGVYARHSHSTGRRVVSVGFTVRHPRADMTEGWHCLVDVEEPCLHFLVTGLRPTYE
jgi:hypothetical protein